MYLPTSRSWAPHVRTLRQLTTKLECNYREMLPLGVPFSIEARVTTLKPRRSTVEWELCSLAASGEEPVRHAFGSADFLLERQKKKPASATDGPTAPAGREPVPS